MTAGEVLKLTGQLNSRRVLVAFLQQGPSIHFVKSNLGTRVNVSRSLSPNETILPLT